MNVYPYFFHCHLFFYDVSIYIVHYVRHGSGHGAKPGRNNTPIFLPTPVSTENCVEETVPICQKSSENAVDEKYAQKNEGFVWRHFHGHECETRQG